MIFKTLEKFKNLVESIEDNRVKGNKETFIKIQLKENYVIEEGKTENIIRCNTVKECEKHLKKVVEKPKEKMRGGKKRRIGKT